MGIENLYSTKKALVEIYLLEKKGVSLLSFYEPNIKNAIELIRIGLGEKTDDKAIELLFNLTSEGWELKNIMYEIMRKSARYVLGSEEMIETIIESVEKSLKDVKNKVDEKVDTLISESPKVLTDEKEIDKLIEDIEIEEQSSKEL